MDKENIQQININNANYPKILKEISDPPENLYMKGKFDEQDKISIAIVGTRNYTSYGKQITEMLAGDLAEAGITIISGLAKGIDTFAHKSALEKSGRTIAVLGSAIDNQRIYPACNRRLAEKISQNGAVISEQTPGTQSKPYFFAQRNRIISGLSLGTLVIEAPEKSGALITAMQAIEQNREVFAVPGPINNKNSVGTNNLIKMGAKLVTCANDILEELNLPLIQKQERKIKFESKEEEILFDILSQTPLHIDEITKKSKLNAGIVSPTLIILELRGLVKNTGGGYYIKL